MKMLTAALPVAAMLVAGSTFAAPTPEEMVKNYGCMTCHDMSAKKVGPTWKDIAAKHKGGKAEELAGKIVSGGKGVYGKIPMPPQPKAQGDSVAIAKWIIGL
jgi:cytochrome c